MEALVCRGFRNILWQWLMWVEVAGGRAGRVILVTRGWRGLQGSNELVPL